MPETDDNQKNIEALYQHNLEIVVKNKTLSLLDKLYETTILKLSPNEMAQSICDIIRIDLNFEIVGIFKFEKEADSLVPLAFSKSERLLGILNKLGFLFKDITITNVSNHDFLKQIIISHTANITNNIEEVWGKMIKPEHLVELKEQSHVQTILLHPLMADREVMGVLLLGLNRNYDSLNAFEKQSIKSIIDMIAVSLDKVYLYKDLQEANARLKLLDMQKSQFLSLASHQLRNPISTILACTSMFLDGSFGSISDLQKRMLNNMYNGAEDMNDSVEKYLTISKIDEGGMQYDLHKIEVNSLVKRAIERQKLLAEDKNLALSADMDDNNICFVNADKVQLKQVIQNLLDNAIKYSEKGWVKIKLSKNPETHIIRFTITDSGMGIKPEIMPELFKEFSRGEAAKVDVGGSGIGLYLAKEIIEKGHGGKIWAESEGEGKGSTFIFELPEAK